MCKNSKTRVTRFEKRKKKIRSLGNTTNAPSWDFCLMQWSKRPKFSSPPFLLCSGAYIHDATFLSRAAVGSCLDKDIDSSPWPPSPSVLKEPCMHAIDFSHCSCKADGRTHDRIIGAQVLEAEAHSCDPFC